MIGDARKLLFPAESFDYVFSVADGREYPSVSHVLKDHSGTSLSRLGGLSNGDGD